VSFNIYYLSNFVVICADVNESIVVVKMVINSSLSYWKCCTHVLVEWFTVVVHVWKVAGLNLDLETNL
jgi:hypothetical protein